MTNSFALVAEVSIFYVIRMADFHVERGEGVCVQATYPDDIIVGFLEISWKIWLVSKLLFAILFWTPELIPLCSL